MIKSLSDSISNRCEAVVGVKNYYFPPGTRQYTNEVTTVRCCFRAVGRRRLFSIKYNKRHSLSWAGVMNLTRPNLTATGGSTPIRGRSSGTRLGVTLDSRLHPHGISCQENRGRPVRLTSMGTGGLRTDEIVCPDRSLRKAKSLIKSFVGWIQTWPYRLDAYYCRPVIHWSIDRTDMCNKLGCRLRLHDLPVLVVGRVVGSRSIRGRKALSHAFISDNKIKSYFICDNVQSSSSTPDTNSLWYYSVEV